MSKEGRSILVIDTEQSWLKFCELALKRNDYEVYTVSSSEEAREMLRAHPESDIALVLIDIKSLEKDEPAVKTLLQSETSSQRSVVVVFPTELTPNRARSAFKLGVSDCVSKPYDETSLLALVEQTFADYRVSIVKETSSTRASSSILIVDDNDDWRADLVKYLPPVDKITTVADYQEAIEAISVQPFDLVVVDLRLVDADDDNFQGMSLIRLIREKDEERCMHTQIIIVSAHGTTDHIRESYRTFKIYYYFDKRYLSPTKYRDTIRDALCS
jgi:DNA-binding NtrC family response regulator